MSKIRRKVLTLLKYLKVLKSSPVQFLFTTRHSPSFFLNQTVPVKNSNNRFEDMEMTAGGSYNMWNFLEWIRKFVDDQQKDHIVKGFPFLALAFSRSVTHFYDLTLAIIFDFFRISKTNPETSVEYLQRRFLNRRACIFSGKGHW